MTAILMALFGIVFVWGLLLYFQARVSVGFFAMGELSGFLSSVFSFIDVRFVPISSWVVYFYLSLPVVFIFIKSLQFFTKKNH